ncbi:MAG: aspartate carbamoyltransferase, partial [Weissella cibaria]
MQNFVNLNELPLTTIQDMIAEALAYKQGERQPMRTPKLVANLFFENSTRTHTSFQ